MKELIDSRKGKIILEPIKEIPAEEMWLFDPKNKHILNSIKRGLKQVADREIDLDSLLKK